MASGTLVRKVMLQISADDGDTETKIDRIAARADELAAKHPELKVRIDTAAAQAKMGVLRQELKDVGRTVEAKIRPVVDQAAAAAALAETTAITTAAGAEAGAEGGAESASSFGSGFSAQGGLIAAGVTAALAALPVIAAGAGAAGGIALGGALLIGTKKVQGPLYAQFHDMTHTLLSVMRVAALPLVKPLGDAFAQIGAWAKTLYPEIKAVFASLGPLVMPLAKGLEGIVSGVLPGFQALMKAAGPAVSAVSSVLSSLSTGLGGMLRQLIPGIRGSAQFLTGLGRVIGALLPEIGSLASVIATVLGPPVKLFADLVVPSMNRAVAQVIPVIQRLASVLMNGLMSVFGPLTRAFVQTSGALQASLMPVLRRTIPYVTSMTGSLIDLLRKAIVPNIPALMKLGTLFALVAVNGIMPLLPPVLKLGSALLGLADTVATPVLPLLTDLANALATVAQAATTVLSALSRVPGLGGLAGGPGYTPASIAGTVMGAVLPPGLTGAASFNAAAAAAGAEYGNNWADGATSAAVKHGVHKAVRKLPVVLAAALAQELQSTPAGIGRAHLKILQAIWNAEKDKEISFGEASDLARWVKADNTRLQGLARERNAIARQIAAAKAYAGSVTSSTESTFGVISAATSITPALGVGGIMRQLLGDVAQIRVFRSNIAKLRRMGLNKAYIDQLIQAGPVQGGQVAAELAAGNEGDIQQVNRAESAIARASRSLGMTAADALYDSGKNAGKGFLSGLESQESQLKKLMKRLADTLVDTLRHELKIHSPSQRVYDLLRNVPAAAVLAIDDGIGGVSAAARRMSRAMLPGPGSAGYAAGSRTVRIELEWTGGGGDQALITLLKHHIRVRGGDPGVLGA